MIAFDEFKRRQLIEAIVNLPLFADGIQINAGAELTIIEIIPLNENVLSMSVKNLT